MVSESLTIASLSGLLAFILLASLISPVMLLAEEQESGSDLQAADTPGSAGAASGQVNGDFNGDGKDDLAIGVVGENLGAGAVNVLYGTAGGISAANDQFWHQDKSGIADKAEAGDNFGWSLAPGDFDGDGFDDLAIGVPGEDIGNVKDAGAVSVIYGTSTGLTSAGNQFWSQASASVLDNEEASDSFGYSVVAGDFNGDGKDDLAIGVPFENVGSIADAGAVNVLYGSNSGLIAAGNDFWNQNSPGIESTAKASENFGQALAAGDFDGDNFDDLAVGTPREDIGSIDSAGAVNVIYGTNTGLQATGDQLWYQDKTGILDSSEKNDVFGSSLASGDFDNDGKDDLAIGVPSEDSHGAVAVIYGTGSGLASGGNQLLTQDTGAHEAESGDRFGAAVAAADFNGDKKDDLAVGVPMEEINGVIATGEVNIFVGSASGLGSRWSLGIWQGTATLEAFDEYASSLSSGDFNNDGKGDLAVGVPLEDSDIGAKTDAGAVRVFYGAANGLTLLGAQLWDQNSSGVEDSVEAGDRFGSSLG